MIVKSTNDGQNFDPIPAGMHIARCFQVIDCGTQPSNNPKFPDRPKVMVGWEIPGEIIEIDGKKLPRVTSQEYTASLSPMANLRKDLDCWRGIPFTQAQLDDGWDLNKVIGVPCMLNIIHETKGDKTYANIASVNPMMKGSEAPAAMLETIQYDIKDATIPEAIPQWIKDKIAKSHNKTGNWPSNDQPKDAPSPAPEAPAEELDDEPPF